MEFKKREIVKPVEVEKEGLYFARTKKENLELITSGCFMLDCVIGGGWPLGRMSNIVGDKSSGKCTVKSATILTDEGFIDLEDLHKSFTEGANTFEINLAISKGNKTKTSHFYKEDVMEYVHIETRHGFTIDVTPNHPLLVWTKDCETVMKRAGSLEVGDIAVISKSTHVYNQDSDLDVNLAFILGVLVADGINPKHGRIDISTRREYLQELVYNSMLCLGVKPFLRKHNVGTSDRIFTQRVYDLLGCPIEFTARNKYVPNCVLNASFEAQAAFLRGLIDCDSWSDNKSLYYYTASKKLAIQIQLMLLNMGIVVSRYFKDGANIGEKFYDHKYWTMGINGRYFNLYSELIGSNKYEFEIVTESKSDFDFVPFLLEKMIQDREVIRQKLGWSRNGKLHDGTRFVRFNYRGFKYAGWNLIKKFIELHEPYESCGLDLSLYRDLLNSGFHFDPIIETSKIELSTAIPAYDVHIPEDHKFWCNGFVSHNTLLAIEACANFNLKYPNGKIVYFETEAAFDEDYAQALGMPIDKIEFASETVKDFTVEAWFEHLETTLAELVKTQQPCLYIVDSLDALSDRAEKEREIDKGTFGANKPKLIGQLFRRTVKEMERSKIHLMIISQIRDNIGVSFGETKSRTGGRAMDFYASQIVWLAQLKRLDRTIKKQKRVYGIQVKAQCKKNKIGLPFRECEFPILFGYGVDEIESMLAWLSSIDFDVSVWDSFKEGRNTLAQSIKLLPKPEREKLVTEIKKMVATNWEEIETKFLPTVSKY